MVVKLESRAAYSVDDNSSLVSSQDGFHKMAAHLSINTARGGQYVPILFLRLSKFTAVLMPTDASTAAITVVGTCASAKPIHCLHILIVSVYTCYGKLVLFRFCDAQQDRDTWNKTCLSSKKLGGGGIHISDATCLDDGRVAPVQVGCKARHV